MPMSATTTSSESDEHKFGTRLSALEAIVTSCCGKVEAQLRTLRGAEGRIAGLENLVHNHGKVEAQLGTLGDAEGRVAGLEKLVHSHYWELTSQISTLSEAVNLARRVSVEHERHLDSVRSANREVVQSVEALSRGVDEFPLNVMDGCDIASRPTVHLRNAVCEVFCDQDVLKTSDAGLARMDSENSTLAAQRLQASCECAPLQERFASMKVQVEQLESEMNHIETLHGIADGRESEMDQALLGTLSDRIEMVAGKAGQLEGQINMGLLDGVSERIKLMEVKIGSEASQNEKIGAGSSESSDRLKAELAAAATYSERLTKLELEAKGVCGTLSQLDNGVVNLAASWRSELQKQFEMELGNIQASCREAREAAESLGKAFSSDINKLEKTSAENRQDTKLLKDQTEKLKAKVEQVSSRVDQFTSAEAKGMQQGLQTLDKICDTLQHESRETRQLHAPSVETARANRLAAEVPSGGSGTPAMSKPSGSATPAIPIRQAIEFTGTPAMFKPSGFATSAIPTRQPTEFAGNLATLKPPGSATPAIPIRQPIEVAGVSATLKRRRHVSLELKQPMQLMDVAGASATLKPSASARHGSRTCPSSLLLSSRQHIEFKVETSSDTPHASVAQASLQPSSLVLKPTGSGIHSPVLNSQQLQPLAPGRVSVLGVLAQEAANHQQPTND